MSRTFTRYRKNTRYSRGTALATHVPRYRAGMCRITSELYCTFNVHHKFSDGTREKKDLRERAKFDGVLVIFDLKR